MAGALNESPNCFLCGRPLGRRVEYHHIIPKSRGGRETSPIHPICHRTIHALLDKRLLEREFAEPSRLRAQPGIARFLDWIRDKDQIFTPRREANAASEASDRLSFLQLALQASSSMSQYR